MTDTHTHIYMPDVYEDFGIAAAERAIEAGVTHLVLPCVNLDSLSSMRRLHEAFPDHTSLAIGLHPTDLGADWERDLDRMEEMLPGDFRAVGEIGIDLYHDVARRDDQKRAFARQLGWAQRYGLPVLVHCREGLDDTLEVISDTGSGSLPLVLHSFTGSIADVERIRQVCDPWFGINGVVTFKNAPALREALPAIGLERILLETDSPWLSPAPLRGRTNESSRIPLIRDCVAGVLGVTQDLVDRVTDASASKLFKFKPQQSTPST